MNLLPSGAWPAAYVARLFPRWWAQRTVRDLLIPPPAPLRAWEQRAEAVAQRQQIRSGLSLLSWCESRRIKQGKVLLVHGWGSRASQMYGFVPLLLDHGFEVLALDAPAHGHSKGKYCEPLSYAQAIAETSASVGGIDAVIGHGIGGLAAALASDYDTQAQAIVLLAAPSSLQQLLDEQLQLTKWPLHQQNHFCFALDQALGRELNQLDVAAALVRSQARLLLIHDREDDEFSYHNLERLAGQVPHAQTWLTQGLGHRKLVRSVEVHLKVTEFVMSALQTQRLEGVA